MLCCCVACQARIVASPSFTQRQHPGIGNNRFYHRKIPPYTYTVFMILKLEDARDLSEGQSRG